MIDWLRALADRPIAEHERRRAFVLAVTVIALAIGVLLLTRAPATHHPSAPHSAPAPINPGPAARPVSPPPSPGPEGETSAGAGLPHDAEAAARRFLGAYLAYLYGHAPARAIQGAAPALRRRLQRERLRVSPATRRRQGRVVSLTARRLAGGRLEVAATVADGGVAHYPLGVLLARRGGRWQATALSSD